VVECGRVDGVDIDENELASMEEMMREAGMNEANDNSPKFHGGISGRSMMSDTNPITRKSLARLTGDENDLLSESPVFTKAKGVLNEGRPSSNTIDSRNPFGPEQ